MISSRHNKKPGSLLISAAFAALISAASPSHADTLADGIVAMPGQVEEVRVGGTWERGGNSGIYRVIVARTGGQAVTARLFVQWVTYTDDGGAKVENTLEIAEFNDLGVDIIDFNSESDADGLSIFIQTLNPNGATDDNYELFIDGPSEYRFGHASN